MEYSDGMKRLLPILLLVFSVGEQRYLFRTNYKRPTKLVQ